MLRKEVAFGKGKSRCEGGFGCGWDRHSLEFPFFALAITQSISGEQVNQK